MITIFNAYENTYKLTADQRNALLRFVDIYHQSANGEWLSDIDYPAFDYFWKSDLEGGSVQGFKPALGKAIVLQPNGDNPEYWVKLVAPVVVHELRHVWQKQKYGFLIYSFLSLISAVPFLYESAPLEKDAFYHQDAAFDLLMNGGNQ